MEKIVDYAVLDAMSGDGLARNVREYIAKGWQPIGGVSVSYNGNVTRFFQAVIRDKK
jgi:hypothetical protein